MYMVEGARRYCWDGEWCTVILLILFNTFIFKNDFPELKNHNNIWFEIKLSNYQFIGCPEMGFDS